MDQPTSAGHERDDALDFDKARFEEDVASTLTCAYCKSTIDDRYYDLNGGTCCERCRHQMEQMRTAGTPFGRFLRALVLGGIGGAVGASVYYTVLHFTGYEVGLVAIVVGLLVGFGVRLGSGGAGGRGYQFLAVALTYVAIVSTYVPFLVEQLRTEASAMAAETSEAQPSADGSVHAVGPEEQPSELVLDEAGVGTYVAAAVIIGIVAMAVPFLAGLENVIGILIIGFALYEAWRVNAYQPFVVEGPFQCSASTAAPSSPHLG